MGMASEEKRTFEVSVIRREALQPALPVQEIWLPLSNLDLLLPPMDVGVFFCYNKPSLNHSNLTLGYMVGVLKKAVAEALVIYYPFGGEVVPNPDNNEEPEILCNNRGVEFIQAYADVELRELNLYEPDDSVGQGKLVPKKQPSHCLAVQVTELKCGGIVVACTFNHQMADAFSANMFFITCSEIAQSRAISMPPFFHRSILNSRYSDHSDPSLTHKYEPITAIPTLKQPRLEPERVVSRIYRIPAEEINYLQQLASSNGYKRSKLQSFSSFLWKMIAKWTKNEDDPKKTCRIGVVVDGRTRLSQGDKEDTNVTSCFGNVLSFPFGEMSVDQLDEKPLSFIANEVNKLIESATKKEHFLSLIDWMGARRPDPAVTKVFCTRLEEAPAFIVSSGLRFLVEKVDFGWGVAAFGAYYLPWEAECGYVMPMPRVGGNGDWVVYTRMIKGQLDFIESEASNVFRPFSFDLP